MAVVIALASIAWPCAHAIDIVYSSGDRHSVVAAHELRRCVASLIMLHHMHPMGSRCTMQHHLLHAPPPHCMVPRTHASIPDVFTVAASRWPRMG
jgi:hypothetical protein